MAKALIVLVAMLMVFGGSVVAEAAGPPVPISGTFFKGPIIGGVDRFVGTVLQVRGEEAVGTLTGTMTGTWTIISAVGPSAPLHGGGKFAGIEEFVTGVTNGVFSGFVH